MRVFHKRTIFPFYLRALAVMTPNAQLSGEDAEDHNVIHILTAGASSKPAKQATSTACYVAADDSQFEENKP